MKFVFADNMFLHLTTIAKTWIKYSKVTKGKTTTSDQCSFTAPRHRFSKSLELYQRKEHRHSLCWCFDDGGGKPSHDVQGVHPGYDPVTAKARAKDSHHFHTDETI